MLVLLCIVAAALSAANRLDLTLTWIAYVILLTLVDLARA